MKKYSIFSMLLVFLATYTYAQQKNTALNIGEFKEVPNNQLQKDKDGRSYYWDPNLQGRVYTEANGDRLIELDEMTLNASHLFNNKLDKTYYMFLNQKLFRVYPYFLKALQQYRDLQADTSSMSDSERHRTVKQRQEALANEYEKQLKDLTTTEGKIFCKLMYRATGETVYDIIKELRGGWSAFWWNVKGNIAEIDLKQPYNPFLYRDDQYIEHILISSWNYGYLQPYEGFETYKVPTSR